MEEVRPSWDNPLQFVFACISFAVGLGNVWRFPYLCQMHGGGGFLIPYMIMLVVEGLPLFYLELTLGQLMRQGSIGAWKTVNPYLVGVGIGSLVISFLVCVYYNAIVSWSLWYLFHSFEVVYVTACFPYFVLIIFLIRGVTLHGAGNGLVYMFTPKVEQLMNPKSWIDAATQIFFSLGLGFGSLIAFASYNQKNNNCEKQAVIIALINSLTSVFASVVTFAIYGFKATYNYESCLERMLLLLTNTFDLEETAVQTDTLDDWIIFLNSTQPNKFATIASQIEKCDLQSHLDTAAEGTGLSFIVFTEAIVNMPGPSQIWSILYFLMLLMLGIGSMLGNAAGVITPLSDMKIISKYLPREVMIGIVCLVACVIGLVFNIGSGNYWFSIFNDYAATLALLVIVLVEVIGICYIYGLRRFRKDIEKMMGRKPNWYWVVTWVFVSPVLIIGLVIFYIVDYSITGTLTYTAWNAAEGHSVKLEYPPYALAVIGLLVSVSTVCIPLAALVTYIKKKLQREKY
ncbi:hypothetical protein chiPu_0008007 [Chiloscyllium punctatum]|uniref:Transporter n=1 Tax=Chiloscyllium punctatum TaxID=137246 RepID=A0A401SGT5_CHIPU|nr:hypothetical protein [Chiloscyllium punctatum]